MSKQLEIILKAVSEETGIAESRILQRTRLREVVDARRKCMYIARELTKFTLGEIGGFFSQHHSTVLCSVKSTTDIIQFDNRFKNSIEDLTKKLQYLKEDYIQIDMNDRQEAAIYMMVELMKRMLKQQL